MAEPDSQLFCAPHEPMRILFICGAGTVSGREIATLNLMAGLKERGHEVRCVASTWGDGRFQQRLEALPVKHISLPLGFISKTLSWSAIWMSLDQLRRVPGLWIGYRRYVREFRPEVVVQSNFHHIFMLWPLLHSDNTFFHVHDSFPNTGFYRRLFRLFNRRLAAFIGVSRYIAESMVRLGVPPGKVSAVYNGVVLSNSSNGDCAGAMRQPEERDNASHIVSIGIVGQVGDWKGHDDFIEALRELRKAGVGFSCTIFGKGEPEYIAALDEKIKAYDLSEQVRHAGFVNNHREIYRAVDICVVPSRVNEAFGMVAAEAAHFGVPVIATRLGALSEIVQDGETGFLVDTESPSQLASKLRLLIEDAALRRRMGRAALRFASGKFTQASMAEQMEAVFVRGAARRAVREAVPLETVKTTGQQRRG
jgi:glycosyltransferase involved in cell wall biosynthesis